MGKGIKRKLMQLFCALLYNANLKGFADNSIYKGKSKGVCVPGLQCYSCPGSIAACPIGSMQNAVASRAPGMLFYILGTLLLFGVLFGRVVCGYLCPFGLLQELLHKIPTPKVKKSRITRCFSWLKYGILFFGVLVLPVWIAVESGIPVPTFCKYICPVGTLEGGLSFAVGDGKYASAAGTMFDIKLGILILLLVGGILIYRIFCRFLCPLGALYSLFNRYAVLGITLDTTRCIQCGKCKAVCKEDILFVGDRECISCGDCMHHCPVNAIGRRNLFPQKRKDEKHEKNHSSIAFVRHAFGRLRRKSIGSRKNDQ